MLDQRGLDKIGVAFTIVTIIVAAIAVAMVRSNLGERVALMSSTADKAAAQARLIE